MKLKNINLFACVFMLSILTLHFNTYTYITDDIWFSKVSNDVPSHIGWVVERYFTWSSRTPIEFALISVINHYNVWSVINSIMFSLLILGLFNIKKGARVFDNFLSIVIISITIYSMPKHIFFSGAIWLTGSINYLWPTAIAFSGYALAIRNYSNTNTPRWTPIICPLFFFLSSFNEQLAISNIIFASALIGICFINNKSTKPNLYLLGASAIVLVYIITCPGNKIRYDAEVVSWFADFKDLSLIQKSLLGLNLFTDAIFSYKTIIPGAAVISLSLLCEKKEKFITVAAGIFLLILPSLNIIPVIFSKTKFSQEDILSYLSVSRVALTLLIISMAVIPALMSFNKNIYYIMAIITFLTSVATTSILGFSPTVYASGARTLFIPYLLMIFSMLCSVSLYSQRLLNFKNAA